MAFWNGNAAVGRPQHEAGHLRDEILIHAHRRTERRLPSPGVVGAAGRKVICEDGGDEDDNDDSDDYDDDNDDFYDDFYSSLLFNLRAQMIQLSPGHRKSGQIWDFTNCVLSTRYKMCKRNPFYQ